MCGNTGEPGTVVPGEYERADRTHEVLRPWRPTRAVTARGIRDAGQVCEGVDPMGRGRAKAKQTKVARDLKYRTHETDLNALARELHGESSNGSSTEAAADSDVDEYDEWTDYTRSNGGRRD